MHALFLVLKAYQRLIKWGLKCLLNDTTQLGLPVLSMYFVLLSKVLSQTNYQTCLSEMGRFPNCPNGHRYSKPQTGPLFSRKVGTILDFSPPITFLANLRFIFFLLPDLILATFLQLLHDDYDKFHKTH